MSATPTSVRRETDEGTRQYKGRWMADGGYPVDAFDRLVEIEDAFFWFEGRNRLISWAIRRYLPEARTFLEIGCGTGFVLRGIHRAFPHMALFGTDLHEQGLAWAARRVPSATLFRGDARELSGETRYDAIGLFDVLEHIDSDQDVLARAFAATRPGGGVLISVPQHPWLWSPADVHAHHVRRYRARTLIGQVTRAGFEVMRATSFMTLLLPLMMVARARALAGDRYDPWSEFHIPVPVNAVLRSVLAGERLLIRSGISLPVGGSLFLVGRRPALEHGTPR